MEKYPIKILLVDDDQAEYFLTEHMLKAAALWSYDLEWASQYPKVLRRIRENEYNVCLIDYYLGEHDGLTLCPKAYPEGV